MESRVSERRRRERQRRIAMVAGLGIIGIAFSLVLGAMPRLVWNASASAPIGLYLVVDQAIARGDFVLATPPEAGRRLAAARGYLPGNVPLVKRVVAMAGDVACATGLAVSINGQAVAARLPTDSHGRPLPAWQGCRRLHPDEFFLLMAGIPDSFDSRYFGSVPSTSVIGKLIPLWTR